MAILPAKKVNKHLPSAFSVEKRTIIISVLVIVVVVLLATEMTTTEAREMGFSGQHTAIRRLDCSVFCRKTGFSGYVGGCQCGFTLFANKRSQQGPQQLFRSRLLSYQAPSKYDFFKISIQTKIFHFKKTD